MAVQKRKAVAKNASDAFKGAKSALSKSLKAEEKEEKEHEDEEMENEDSENPEVEDEPGTEQCEEEIITSRRKELKSMYMSDLQGLISMNSLEEGKKEQMIESLISFEAKQRADARAHEARIRQAIMNKKEEFEAMPLSELRKLCAGNMTKDARVETCLKQWQEEDGVDKELKRIGRDLRENELSAMDKPALRNLCNIAGIDPHVKEVMIERIVKTESANGRFARPAIEDLLKAEEVPPSKAGKAVDMVETLLANENNRKKEQELKRKDEEKVANKMRVLKAMSVEELKKALTKKGKELSGKKEELVEALFSIGAQEEAAAEKKAKLKALSMEDLKSLASKRSVAMGNKKDTMVDDLLAHEAKMHEAMCAFETRVNEVLARKQKELETKTASDLKELCLGKSLKAGQSKEDRVERLVEELRSSGELDKISGADMAVARRKELLATDKQAVLQICDALGVDAMNKEFMIECLMTQEEELGCQTVEEQEPPSKKAKLSKN